MNDTAIKNYCIWARNELIAGVEARMRLYGVAEGAEPAGATAVGGRALSPEETEWRDALLRAGAEESFEHLRDRAAYTWFNRIAAVRYMEVHDFLPSRVRMFTRPAADGSWELGSQAVDEALDVEIAGADPARIAELKQAGEDGPLFRYLFLAQCAELSGCLSGVFQPVDACMALLLPANLMDPDGVIGRMVGDIPEEDWRNVQVLGWMYQYYNSEVKDAFFASRAKEAPDTIGPATQLFTPDWIVRYMVQNSLGRLWMLNNPGSPLRAEMEYYIEPDAEHEDFIRIGGPEDISLCDPACGSGHILVYAFELLAKMYLERGYREREIPGLVLSKNLHGMEIDPRAAQIARLALAMCARGMDLLASIYFSPVSLSRRAVRAKAVSPVALTYFHRFRSRLDGAVPRQVLQPVGPAGYLDQVAVVAHPVRDRARRHVVPEHPAPAADPHVGGDDRRALLVARRYQLEQQVRARAADVEVAELVDDQQPRVGVVLEPLLEDAARRGVLEVLDEPGAVHEPDLTPRPDRLDAKRDGEVRLAHAGAPHEQDVLGPLDEPQGRELLDLGARDRRLEVPVEVRQPLDVGEPRRPYALVGDPDLPGGDLDARHLLEG